MSRFDFWGVVDRCLISRVSRLRHAWASKPGKADFSDHNRASQRRAATEAVGPRLDQFEPRMMMSGGDVRIIDDGDAVGYSTIGGAWSTSALKGYQNDSRFATKGDGSKKAVYTFTDLEPGEYRVSANWSAHAERATDTPYSITSPSEGKNFGTFRLNQEVAANDFTADGGVWEDITGNIMLHGTSLVVTISNDANETVIADGVRIERVGDLPANTPEIQITDGTGGYLFTGGSWNTGISYLGTAITKTFNLQNVGNADLILGETGIAVPEGYTLTPPTKTTLAPGESTSFSVTRDQAYGTAEGTLSFTSNDADEGLFEMDLFSLMTGTPRIIDDGDAAGYSYIGTAWSNSALGGYKGDSRFAQPGDGSHKAVYTFNDVTPGIYQLAVTYSAHAERATDAHYVALDVNSGVVLADKTINQELVPNDFTADGGDWVVLANAVTVEGSLITVTLDNKADEVVIADAVRLVRVGDLPGGSAPEVEISISGMGNVISGAALAYGELTPGTVIEKTLTIKNIGSTVLDVAGISLPTGLMIMTPYSEILVDPGTQIELPLELTAGNLGGYTGAILIENNDTNEATFTVPVSWTVADAPIVIDDGDASFTTKGTWSLSALPGYQNDNRFATKGDGSKVATWTFTDLEPGIYRVSTTYSAHAERATNAPYTVTDPSNPDGKLSVAINQELVPSDLTFNGKGWVDLSTTFEVTGDSLVVTLNNLADETVIADAVRVQRVGELGSDEEEPVENTAPQVWGGSYHLGEGIELEINNPYFGLLGLVHDTEGSELSITGIVTSPRNGTLVFAPNGTFTYTAKSKLPLTDWFTFEVSDGELKTVSQKVYILPGESDLPQANEDTWSITHSRKFISTKGALLANDISHNGPLLIELVTGPTDGTLVLEADGSFEFTPTKGMLGDVSFTYKVTDHTGATANAQVTLSVVNQGPVVWQRNLTTHTATSLLITTNTLIGTAADQEFDVISVVSVSQPGTGTLTKQGDEGWLYQPGTGSNYDDTFTYILTDGFTETQGTMKIRVENQLPVATGLSVVANESGAVSFGANDPQSLTQSGFDPEGVGPLTAHHVEDPSNGVATIHENGSWTYTPNVGFVGTDWFRYRLHDGIGYSEPAKVQIYVQAIRPQGLADSYEINADETLSVDAKAGVLANDYNSTALPVLAILASGSLNGELEMEDDGSFIYTPDSGFSGTDSFSYRAVVDNAQSDPVQVVIQVSNETPLAWYDYYAVGVSVVISAEEGVLANDFEPDNQTLSAHLHRQANHGHVTLESNGSFTYNADVGFTGWDSFEYMAYDGHTYTEPTLVILEVANSAPAGVDDYYAITSNAKLTVNTDFGVLANDSDDQSLTAVLLLGPGNGTVELASDGSFAYTPNSDFTGVDGFIYRAYDGTSYSIPLVVTIDVTNAQPSIIDPIYTLSEDFSFVSPHSLIELGSDLDGDVLTWDVVSEPVNGTLIVDEYGYFTYIPDPDFSGVDSFQYRLKDGLTYSPVGNVSFKIDPVNDLPTIVTLDLQTNAGSSIDYGSLGLALMAADADGDPITWQLVTSPMNGTLSLNPFIYTPNTGFVGQDSFTVTLNDGSETTDPIQIFINVINHLPQVPATAGVRFVKADATTVIDPAQGLLAGVIDPDGHAVSAKLVGGPSSGSLTVQSNGGYIFTPDNGFSGSVTFTYQVGDGYGWTDVVEHTIQVVLNPVVLNGETYYVHQGQQLTAGGARGVLVNDLIPSGYWLELISDVQNGELTLGSNGQVTYAPEEGFSGIDIFTYRLTNGTDSSNVASAFIYVRNHAPVAVDDRYEVRVNSELEVPAERGVLANDYDHDADELVDAVVVNQPTHGTVTFDTNGSFVYTPDKGYVGKDSFTYEISDNVENSQATVSIEVINQAPVGAAVSHNVHHLSVLKADLKPYTYDADGDEVTLVLVADASKGTLTWDEFSFTYTPNPGFTGPDEFVYKLYDGFEFSANYSISINVENRTPSGQTQTHGKHFSNATFEGNALKSAIDHDGDPLHVIWVTEPEVGTFQGNKDGTYTLTFEDKDLKITTQKAYFQISDGASLSPLIPVVFEVYNNAPQAVSDALLTSPGKSVGIDVLANDIDIDDEDIYIEVFGFNKSQGFTDTSTEGGVLSFTSSAKPGTYTFSYRTYNKVGESALSYGGTGQVTVIVTGLPIGAVDDTYTIGFGESVENNVSTNDMLPLGYDGQWEYFLVEESTTDKYTIKMESDGSFKFSPSNNFTTAILGYGVKNESGMTYYANLTVVSTEAEVKVIADAFDFTYGSEGKGNVTLKSDMLDLDFTVELLEGPSHGDITLEPDGSFVYNGHFGFVGYDQFTYRITTETGITRESEASVLVRHERVVGVADEFEIDYGQLLVIDIDKQLACNDFAFNCASLVVEIYREPLYGSLFQGWDGLLGYQPGEGFTGEDVFYYVVRDETGIYAADPVAVTITVGPGGDISLKEDFAWAYGGDAVVIDVLDNDNLGNYAPDDVQVILHSNPQRGKAEVVGTNIVYTPAGDVNDEVSFYYQVNVGDLHREQMVTVRSVRENIPIPAYKNQEYSLYEDHSMTTHFNDGLVDLHVNDVIYVELISDASNGTFTIDPFYHKLVYQPDANFYGTDSVTIQVYGENWETYQPTTISYTVLSVNDVPHVKNMTVEVSGEGQQPVSFDIVSHLSDVEDPASSLKLVSFTPTYWPTRPGTISFSGTQVTVDLPVLNEEEEGYWGPPQDWMVMGAYNFVVEDTEGGQQSGQVYISYSDDYPMECFPTGTAVQFISGWGSFAEYIPEDECECTEGCMQFYVYNSGGGSATLTFDPENSQITISGAQGSLNLDVGYGSYFGGPMDKLNLVVSGSPDAEVWVKAYQEVNFTVTDVGFSLSAPGTITGSGTTAALSLTSGNLDDIQVDATGTVTLSAGGTITGSVSTTGHVYSVGANYIDMDLEAVYGIGSITANKMLSGSYKATGGNIVGVYAIDAESGLEIWSSGNIHEIHVNGNSSDLTADIKAAGTIDKILVNYGSFFGTLKAGHVQQIYAFKDINLDITSGSLGSIYAGRDLSGNIVGASGVVHTISAGRSITSLDVSSASYIQTISAQKHIEDSKFLALDGYITQISAGSARFSGRIIDSDFEASTHITQLSVTGLQYYQSSIQGTSIIANDGDIYSFYTASSVEDSLIYVSGNVFQFRVADRAVGTKIQKPAGITNDTGLEQVPLAFSGSLYIGKDVGGFDTGPVGAVVGDITIVGAMDSRLVEWWTGITDFRIFGPVIESSIRVGRVLDLHFGEVLNSDIFITGSHDIGTGYVYGDFIGSLVLNKGMAGVLNVYGAFDGVYRSESGSLAGIIAHGGIAGAISATQGSIGIVKSGTKYGGELSAKIAAREGIGSVEAFSGKNVFAKSFNELGDDFGYIAMAVSNNLHAALVGRNKQLDLSELMVSQLDAPELNASLTGSIFVSHGTVGEIVSHGKISSDISVSEIEEQVWAIGDITGNIDASSGGIDVLTWSELDTDLTAVQDIDVRVNGDYSGTLRSFVGNVEAAVEGLMAGFFYANHGLTISGRLGVNSDGLFASELEVNTQGHALVEIPGGSILGSILGDIQAAAQAFPRFMDSMILRASSTNLTGKGRIGASYIETGQFDYAGGLEVDGVLLIDLYGDGNIGGKITVGKLANIFASGDVEISGSLIISEGSLALSAKGTLSGSGVTGNNYDIKAEKGSVQLEARNIQNISVSSSFGVMLNAVESIDNARVNANPGTTAPNSGTLGSVGLHAGGNISEANIKGIEVTVRSGNDVTGEFNGKLAVAIEAMGRVNDVTVESEMGAVGIDGFDGVSGTFTAHPEIDITSWGDVTGTYKTIAYTYDNPKNGQPEEPAKLTAPGGSVAIISHKTFNGTVVADSSVAINAWDGVSGTITGANAFADITLGVFSLKDIDATITSTKGSVNIEGGGSVTGAINAGQEIDIYAEKDVTGVISGLKGVRITATKITSETVKAAEGDVEIYAHDTINTDVTARDGILASAGNDITLTANNTGGGSVNVTSIEGNITATITAPSGTIWAAAKKSVNMTISDDGNAPSKIDIYAFEEALGKLRAKNEISVFTFDEINFSSITTEIGSVSLVGQENVKATVTAGGDISASTLKTISGSYTTRAGSAASISLYASETITGTVNADADINATTMQAVTNQATFKSGAHTAVYSAQDIASNIDAGGNATVVSLESGINSAQIKAGGLGTLTAKEAINTMLIAGSANVVARKSVSGSITTNTGGVEVTALDGLIATINAATDVNATTTDASGNITAAGKIDLIALGTITGNVTSTAGGVTATATKVISGNISGYSGVTVFSGANLTGAVTSTAGSVDATTVEGLEGEISAAGSVTASVLTDASGKITAGGSADLSIFGSLTGAVDVDGNLTAIILGSHEASMKVGGNATYSVAGSYQANTEIGGNIIGAYLSGFDGELTAHGSGNLTILGELSGSIGGGSIYATVSGTVSAESQTTDHLSITSIGGIQSLDANSGGGITLVSYADLTAELNAAGSINITASGETLLDAVSTQSGISVITLADLIAELSAKDLVKVEVAGETTITLTSTHGNADVLSVGKLTAGGHSAGTMQLAGLDAVLASGITGGSLVATAMGDLQLKNISLSGSAQIAGLMTVTGSVTADGDVAVTSKDNLVLQVDAGRLTAVGLKNIDITGDVSGLILLLAKNDITLTAVNAGSVSLTSANDITGDLTVTGEAKVESAGVIDLTLQAGANSSLMAHDRLEGTLTLGTGSTVRAIEGIDATIVGTGDLSEIWTLGALEGQITADSVNRVLALGEIAADIETTGAIHTVWTAGIVSGTIEADLGVVQTKTNDGGFYTGSPAPIDLTWWSGDQLYSFHRIAAELNDADIQLDRAAQALATLVEQHELVVAQLQATMDAQQEQILQEIEVERGLAQAVGLQVIANTQQEFDDAVVVLDDLLSKGAKVVQFARNVAEADYNLLNFRGQAQFFEAATKHREAFAEAFDNYQQARTHAEKLFAAKLAQVQRVIAERLAEAVDHDAKWTIAREAVIRDLASALKDNVSKKLHLDKVQKILEVLSYIPVLGSAANAVNAGISLLRGNYLEAAIMVVGSLPIVGQYSSKAALALTRYVIAIPVVKRLLVSASTYVAAHHRTIYLALPIPFKKSIGWGCFIGDTYVLFDANAVPPEAESATMVLDVEGYFIQQETTRGFFSWQTGTAIAGGIMLMATAGRMARKRNRGVRGDEKLKLVGEDESHEETPLDRLIENLTPVGPAKLRLLG